MYQVSCNVTLKNIKRVKIESLLRKIVTTRESYNESEHNHPRNQTA
jgi:hypothetical protein